MPTACGRRERRLRRVAQLQRRKQVLVRVRGRVSRVQPDRGQERVLVLRPVGSNF